MINAWHDLPAGPRPPDEVTAVVEIQRWEKSELAADVILDSMRRYDEKYMQHGP